MSKCGQVPENCENSYTVPIPKGDYICGRELKVGAFFRHFHMFNNFKAFVNVITAIQCFLSSSDGQFGFKPGLSCSHAIYSVRKVVDHYVNGGSTINICNIDMSKAFDIMNHSALFLSEKFQLIF